MPDGIWECMATGKPLTCISRELGMVVVHFFLVSHMLLPHYIVAMIEFFYHIFFQWYCMIPVVVLYNGLKDLYDKPFMIF